MIQNSRFWDRLTSKLDISHFSLAILTYTNFYSSSETAKRHNKLYGVHIVWK